MTILELKRILANLPDNAKVSIYCSQADNERDIKLAEWYGPGKGLTLMLLDQAAEPTNCVVLFDDDEEPGML